MLTSTIVQDSFNKLLLPDPFFFFFVTSRHISSFSPNSQKKRDLKQKNPSSCYTLTIHSFMFIHVYSFMFLSMKFKWILNNATAFYVRYCTQNKNYKIRNKSEVAHWPRWAREPEAATTNPHYPVLTVTCSVHVPKTLTLECRRLHSTPIACWPKHWPLSRSFPGLSVLKFYFYTKVLRRAYKRQPQEITILTTSTV